MLVFHEVDANKSSVLKLAHFLIYITSSSCNKIWGNTIWRSVQTKKNEHKKNVAI